MEKRVRTILQSTLILLAAGIFVQVNAQPVVVRDIPTNSSGFLTVGDLVYFTSGNELWRTDGTASGTISIGSGFTQFSSGRGLNGIFYFLNAGRRELWRTDGTPSGTFRLKTSGSAITFLDSIGNVLLFTASDASTGVEPYKTDGTISGTQLIRDILPGSEGSFPTSAATVANNVFFFANDGQHGSEPWKTDGSSGGTVMIEDINPGIAGSRDPSIGVGVFSYNNRYYFSAGTSETGIEPWISDGSEQGTVLLKEVVPGSGSPEGISYKIQHNGLVYFEAQIDPVDYQTELWRTSGTSESTLKLSELGSNSYGSVYRIFKNQVYFVTEASTACQYFKTDGTAAGTIQFFEHLAHGGGNEFFDTVNGYLIFYGNHDGSLTYLYRSDGTQEGTEPLTSFKHDAYLRGGPRDMTKVGDYVFYGDHDGLTEDGYGDFPYSEEDYFHLMQTDAITVESMRTMFGISTIGTHNITDYKGSVIFTTHDDRGDAAAANPKRLWIYEPMDPPKDSAVFMLVQAQTDEDVRRITEGARLVQPEYNPQPINITYVPVETPGSVVFRLNDVVVRTETAPPYSLGGDVNGDYATWQPGFNSGTYKLTATPYSGTGGTGTPGESLTVNFTIERQGPPEPEVCSASGTILREYWDNVSGNSVSSIPVNSTPTSASELTIFEGPTNVDTNYGARISGYICPPTSGTYTFWIASNDNSELWLSTNDSPRSRQRIAYVNGATNPRQWDKFSTQRSVGINLVAGQLYYIEALHKQGVGTDNVAVGWQLPGGAMERPIPGNRLSPFGTRENTAPLVTIEDPDNGDTFTQPVDITINATASDREGSIAKVEFYDYGQKLGEDLTAPYSFVWRNAPSGPHTLTATATDNEGRVGSSSQTQIRVNSPCEPRGSIAWELWRNVPGDRVSDVPVNSPPTSKGQTTKFEWATNFADRYATRLRGYICPPMTGNYYFWIASNDHSELWLSTDDDPANKMRIAWVTGATNPREWNKYPSQISPPIMLESGRRYYIESLHKESIGSDHLSVGWQWPNGALERPIDGFRLSPFGYDAARMASDDKDTSLEETLVNHVNIYPNPIESGEVELTVSGYDDITTTIETDVEIINLTGDIIFAERISCGGDCSSYLMKLNNQLVPGVYLVNMKTNGVRVSKRLLVK